MIMNRTAAVQLAATLPQGDPLRREILSRLIESKEHATEEARKNYLKEQPDADPKNHTVKPKGDKDKSDDKEDKPKGGFLSRLKSWAGDKLDGVLGNDLAWIGQQAVKPDSEVAKFIREDTGKSKLSDVDIFEYLTAVDNDRGSDRFKQLKKLFRDSKGKKATQAVVERYLHS